MFNKKKGLIRLFCIIAAEALLIFFVVWLFDPFYQYHAPFGGREAVLNDRDNQMPGSIRNLTYDSVLVGSSVTENCNSSFLDEKYDCNTLKIIRASGSAADLLYYLEMAEQKQELKNVFWCLDLTAVSSEPECTLYGGDVPRYLHTETILDDNTYIFNKEILFETIPTMLAYEREGRNVGGNAYDWSRDKEFSAAKAMQAYTKPDVVLEQQDFTESKEKIRQNLEMIAEQIESHPEITYRFIFPPYSMIWWDCAYVNGQLEERFYILEQTLPVLLDYDNVEIYYYHKEKDIVCNLDNYMDLVHYCPDVNQYMLDQMYAGEGRVTAENWESVLLEMRDFVREINEELIYEYYPRQ